MPNLPTEDELDKSIKYFGVARGLTWEQAEQLVVDLQPAINHYVTKRELEARIDEAEMTLYLKGKKMFGNENPVFREIEGWPASAIDSNAVRARLNSLKAQKEQESK